MPAARTYGLRFSLVDASAIVVAGLGTWLVWPLIGDFALSIPIVLGHFFLFCNVFRVRRTYELYWAAIFLVNVGGWLASGAFDWWWVLAVQSPATLAAIIAEVRSPQYHGIFCRRGPAPGANAMDR
jgi:hypothetical protein